MCGLPTLRDASPRSSRHGAGHMTTPPSPSSSRTCWRRRRRRRSSGAGGESYQGGGSGDRGAGQAAGLGRPDLPHYHLWRWYLAMEEIMKRKVKRKKKKRFSGRICGLDDARRRLPCRIQDSVTHAGLLLHRFMLGVRRALCRRVRHSSSSATPGLWLPCLPRMPLVFRLIWWNGVPRLAMPVFSGVSLASSAGWMTLGDSLDECKAVRLFTDFFKVREL